MGSLKQQLKISAIELRTHYQLIIALVLVLASIFIVYGNDFAILANEALQNEALSHILLLPFFVGFILYLKKDAVKASIALPNRGRRANTKHVNELLGVVLCLVAFLVYWYSSQTFYPLEYHILSLPIFVAGITLILLNPLALRALIFPILFLLFLVPLPATVLYTIGGGLANFNTQVSYSILKTAGLPITLSSSYGSPTILLTSASGQPVNFAVDIACSGIYSLVAFAMFATFLAFLAKTSIFKKLLLFVLGFFVFTILNITRIMGIVIAGYSLGEDAALLLHSFAGIVLIFIGMLLLLGFSDKILKIPIQTKLEELSPCPKCKNEKSSNLANFCQNCGRFLGKSTKLLSKNLFMKLCLLLLGCSIVVLTIRAPTFATSQDSIELSSSGNLQNAASVFPETSNYTLTFLYRDVGYEKLASQDISLVYGYFPTNISKPVVYALIGVSSSISNLHNWEVCFVTMETSQGRAPLVNVYDSRDIQLLKDPPLIAKYIVFDSPNNYTQVTLYWYEKATFKTGLTVEQKYVRISLIILTQDSTDYKQLEQELRPLAFSIATTWEPLKTQALISLGIPAQQAMLVASISFLAFTLATQYFTERRKTSNNLKLFNNFASPKEKIVFQSIIELSKGKKNLTTSDILEKVPSRGRGSVSAKQVLHILNILNEYGLIRRTLVSVNSNPVLVWNIYKE